MFGRLKRIDPLTNTGQVSFATPRINAALGQTPGQTLEIGRSAQGQTITIPTKRLASHLVVTGQPGVGKTTFVTGLVQDLVSQGISVVIFEPAKVEYADALHEQGLNPQLMEVFGDDGRADTKPLQVNPFAVDVTCRPRVWIQAVSEAMQDAFGLHEQPLPMYLNALIARLYREKKIDMSAIVQNSSAQWPSVVNFLTSVSPYVEEETCAGKEVSSNVRGALTLRGRTMCQSPALGTKRGIMAQDLLNFGGGVKILQLADLGREIGSFVGMIILLRAMQKSRTLGKRGLHTVFILEEAHSLLVDYLTGQETLFAREYESCIAEQRAAGIGYVTVEQRPSLLPSGVLANSVSKIAFASSHNNDREAIAGALGLTDEQKRRIGALNVGQALFQTIGMDGAQTVCVRNR